MNDGSAEEIQQNKTLHRPHNLKTHVISYATTATKTLELERNLVYDTEFLGSNWELMFHVTTVTESVAGVYGFAF